MQSREHALITAGYAVASASTLTAAKEMAQLCKFDIVLLDHECVADEKAKIIQQHHVSVLLESGTTERQLLHQLGQLLQVASASAAVH
jgi:DNA-binding response OmpR family regulator